MKLRSLNLLLIAAILLTACATATPQSAPPAQATSASQQPTTTSAAAGQTIKVGALYPLTGPDAGWAGDPYVKSHQLAIDEINAAGGIACMGGAKLELVKGDTQSKAETGNSE